MNLTLVIAFTVILILLAPGCQIDSKTSPKHNKLLVAKVESLDSIVFKKEYVAFGFDFPVGIPDAKGYYNAQGFGENLHLGDDWNSVQGGNSDLGDPIYSIANGFVSECKNLGGGWGNVIRLIHKLPSGEMIESVYAHCDTMFVERNTWIKRGKKIGTIGNANGQYLAHLHLEIRDSLNMPIGAGYARDMKGYINPTKFIGAHRSLENVSSQ